MLHGTMASRQFPNEAETQPPQQLPCLVSWFWREISCQIRRLPSSPHAILLDFDRTVWLLRRLCIVRIDAKTMECFSVPVFTGKHQKERNTDPKTT